MHTRQILVPLRVSSFVTALLFSWSLILASTVRAAVDRPLLPPGHSRALSAKEMSQITGAAPAPGGDGGGDTGGGGGGTYTNPAATPGSAYSWIGSVGGVSTYTGNKTTAIPFVSYAQHGTLPVALTLVHNSQSSRNGELGPKWLMSYDSAVIVDGNGNPTVYWGNGSVCTFMKNVNGSYTAPPGIHDIMTVSGSGSQTQYRVTKKDQTYFAFNPGIGTNYYRLAGIADENNNYILIYYVSGTNIVHSISDSTYRAITLGYTGNLLTSVTDPLNHVWTLSYDGSGNLAHVYWPALNGTSYHIDLGYDSSHDVISIQDKRNNSSTFSYNADYSLAWEKDSFGNQTRFSYSSNVTTITDPNSHTTTHAYNSSGQLASVTDALGYTEYYAYDTANNVTRREDRNQQFWYSTFDGMGNVLTATPPGGSASVMTYNADNRLLTAQAPLGRSVAITYDSNNNPTQVQQKDAAGNVLATTKLTVGAYGLVSDKYDANNHHTSYTYDANGYLSSVTTPLGHKTQWTYDALGFPTQRVDAMGRTTYYTPDAWERLVTTTYPDNSTHTFSYDANGNLLTWTDPATGTWSRGYDADNRLLGEFTNGTQVVAHHYDAAGQLGLLSTTSDYYGRTLTYSYTSRSELSVISEPAGVTSYAYDPNGNQTSVYSDGHHSAQYYNADNTLDSLYNYSSYGQGTAVFSSYGYSYNADHQMTGYNEGQSANVHTTANPTQTTYGYDPQGHLTGEVRTGSTPYSYGYGYDPQGNRTSKTVGAAGFTQYYDSDDELTQINSPASLTFGYNANGDQITTSANAVITNFGYDYDDQLVSLTKPGYTATYVYDALGRQVGRTAQGTATSYYYDRSAVLFESRNGTETGVYTWGNGLVRRNGEWALLDGVGSARQMTDGGQTVTSSSVLTAYGQTLAAGGSTSCGYTFQASGGYRTDSGDAPAGGSNYTKVGARYYDAEWGRFITRDTELSQSPYAYCDGDPVNCTDPSGHLSAVNIASSGVSTINGPTGTGGGASVSSDPGNKPNPSLPAPSNGVSVPDGSGGDVTVTPAGGGANISDTQGPETISGTIDNRGNLSSVGESGTIPLGGLLAGLGATFSGRYNLGTGIGSSSAGLSYSHGGFTGGFSTNGSSFTLSGGYKGTF